MFDCLLESIRESQEFILEVNGHLTTLTVCVILPVTSSELDSDDKEKFVVCACNVGDSLGYVYGKSGVREFTQGEVALYTQFCCHRTKSFLIDFISSLSLPN